MGSYVSKSKCPQQGIELKCDVEFDPTDPLRTIRIGGLGKGEIPPDGDVAGVGIVSVFVAVTSLALFLSAIDLLWTVFKHFKWKRRHSEQQKQEREESGDHWSFSRLCEAIILSCSDQQVFTGGAFAITLRYAQGCFIRAYHYNIVANMMLLTCATHLMAITMVRDYWRYPWLGFTRVVLTTLVFLVTGVMLSNQNGNTGDLFPTVIPPPNDNTFLMFRHAACFQDDQTFKLTSTLESSVATPEQFKNAVAFSTPGNHIQGWNFYIITLLWYAAAILVEVARFFNRGRSVPGRRQTFVVWFSNTGFARFFKTGRWLSKILSLLLLLYLMVGIGISAWTVGSTATYMYGLRTWARQSGWLIEYDSGFINQTAKVEARKSDEDIATSFGQMVPILLCALTFFAAIERISEMKSAERSSRKYSLSGNVTPALSRRTTFQPGLPVTNPSNNGLPTKLSPKVTESQAGAMTPGQMGAGPTTPGMAMTPGMTPMTLGFPGSGLALNGTNPYFQGSPYASQINTGSTPLLGGPGGFFPAMFVNGNGNGNGGYFVSTNPDGRQNSTISATTTLNQQPIIPSQQAAMGSQVFMPPQHIIQGQPVTATPPPMVRSPSPPIGTAIGTAMPMAPQQQQQRPSQAAPQPQQQHAQYQQHQHHVSADGYLPFQPAASVVSSGSVVGSEPAASLHRRTT